MLAALLKDIKFYHQLAALDRRPCFFRLVWVLFSSPGLLALAVHRLQHDFYNWHPTKKLECFLNFAARILFIFGEYFTEVAGKIDIATSSLLEPGIFLSNKGHVILGARVVGSGTMVHDRVTIGRNLFDRGVPEIGRNVWIGPSTIIYGHIKIDDGVTILSNTVLTKSIPANTVVKGNPARVIRRCFDNAELRSTLNAEVEYDFFGKDSKYESNDAEFSRRH